MIDPGLSILLTGGKRHYEPGDTLIAEYRVDSLALVDAKAMEASVVWYTVGKGEEDFGVHQFVRHASDDGTLFDCRKPRLLRTVLPVSPLSYDGVIVKLRWCVRVRLFPSRGREVIAESPFQLGNVPAIVFPTAETKP